MFPDRVPIDEEVALSLVAVSKKYVRADPIHVPVTPAGQFRVEVPADFKRVEVSLLARHLYLEKPVSVAAQAASDPIVLAPKLGACLVGHVVLPRTVAATDPRIEALPIELVGSELIGRGRAESVLERSVTVDASLAFEFQGLPSDLQYELSSASRDFAPSDQGLGFHLEPGQTSRIDLALRLGARIRGRLVDEAGEGVHADLSCTHPCAGSEGKPPQVGKDGRFEEVIAPGPGVSLTVQAKGYLKCCADLGTLAEGEERNGIELVLRRGQRVSGRVQWPDGSPAPGCKLKVVQERPADPKHTTCWSWPEHELSAGEGGRFELTGLRPEPCSITARIEKAIGDRPAASITRDHVVPDAVDLVLVLDEGRSITGIVVDDMGMPITTYEVRVRETDPSRLDTGSWYRAASIFVREPSGRFRIAGLEAGTYAIAVESRDHAATEITNVRVGSSEDLRIVLARWCMVSGTVVDSRGTGVPRVRVQVSTPLQPFLFHDNDKETLPATDLRGLFEAPHVRPGHIQLTAIGQDLADSAPLELDLAPGQKLTDLKLVQTAGGTIRGRVLDESGAPIASVHVSIRPERSGFLEHVTDVRGEFSITSLAPGRYRLQAPQGEQPEAEQHMAWSSNRFVKNVQVGEGQEVTVLLGGAGPTRTHVKGRISSKGVPAPGVQVWGESDPGWSRSTADAQGRYEIELEPGACSIGFAKPDSGTIHKQAVVVPAAKHFQLDLEMPSARLAGRIVDTEGRGVVAYVQLERMDPWARSRGFVKSAADGSFAFMDVEDGTWSVSTMLRDHTQSWNEKAHGPARIEDIHVEGGASRTDLVLRLPRVGRLRGVVSDATGFPVARAHLSARGGDGRNLAESTNAWTDGQGRFEIDCLPPGKLRIQARTPNSVSKQLLVEVRPDQDTTVNMTLAAGTLLCVFAQDADGVACRAALSVRDEAGSEFGCRAWASEGIMEIGDTRVGFPVGPLCKGRLMVTVVDDSGRKAVAEVLLDGENERSVTLRLPR